MSSKRIMLLGSSGQVGQALQAVTLPTDWQLGALNRSDCDITDHLAVQNKIQTFKPDMVINAAAMTAVDKCETEVDQATAANFHAAANLAAQCAAHDIPLIHLSTDYVFDGSDGSRPYKEDDQLNPLGIYAQTKLMGEEAIRHEHAFHVILRISWVFSAFGTNLLTKMLAAIDMRDELKMVTDQVGGPTPAQDVAKTLIRITDALLHGKAGGYGTFHFCGIPGVNRFEFAQTIMDAYAPYTSKRPKILPALSVDFPGFAPRPPYSVLDCTKIRDVYGIVQRPWQDGLAEAMKILMRDRRQVA